MPNQAVGPKARVLVQRLKDGTLRVVSEDREVKHREIFPMANHPWRKGLRLRKRAANSEH